MGLSIKGNTLSFTDLHPHLCNRDSPLPYSLRMVLENLLRTGNAPGDIIKAVANWSSSSPEIFAPLSVSRVILPDSSGLPVLMDLAALRDALVREGLDAGAVQPSIPVDLVVDHSLMVDRAGSSDAEAFNVDLEYKRNGERYSFFKWAQQAFEGVRVVPPGMGIIHQVHIERLAKVIATTTKGDREIVHPEFVLGGDSHTTMVNALGVLGWGVGGIEAVSAMLGKPYIVRIPRVVGVRLTGTMRPGTTTTDLVLTLTETLRGTGVVGDFVEFTGPALKLLTTAERATLANMAPEYGATMGYFPIDARTIEYLHHTGRDKDHVNLIETAAKAIGIFRELNSEEPEFSQVVEIDLSTVEPSLAGPKRPQDRVAASELSKEFVGLLEKTASEGGFGVSSDDIDKHVNLKIGNSHTTVGHGTLAIAAITSCTNTSNPSVMIGAGLLAKNAIEKGLNTPVHVKTSMAPGSRVVTRYLESAGLLSSLETLGFYIVGYGCTTCSGKSGPLAESIVRAVQDDGIVTAAVISGNRNFEGRIHRFVKANYIASPMLVIAYALAGRVDIDISLDPLGHDAKGQPVFLCDIWPSESDITDVLFEARKPNAFKDNYESIFEGTGLWQKLEAPSGPLFPWDDSSTYIKEPPFFQNLYSKSYQSLTDSFEGARVLCAFSDSLTTDHIIPSGEITRDSSAGQYLLATGVTENKFNAMTMRRGNHDVMIRGTFANPRIKNLLVPDINGGTTLIFPQREQATIFEAARKYRHEDTPVIVFAGKDYGMGSSRDWAAKGPALLGVRVVIAESFERIHRSNLIGMGIIPLCFKKGDGWRQIGLDGSEIYTIRGILNGIKHGEPITVEARTASDTLIQFIVCSDIGASFEIEYLIKGGIFPTVLNEFLNARTGADAAE